MPLGFDEDVAVAGFVGDILRNELNEGNMEEGLESITGDVGHHNPAAEDDIEDEDDGVISSAPAITLAKTPAKALSKTPQLTEAEGTTHTTSARKRKAVAGAEAEAVAEPTLAKRQHRPARTAATSAPLATKEATKKKRGRPAKTETTDGAKAPAKRGRKPGVANGTVPKGEYEVEEILESQIDGDTMEHMYQVKWKGYSKDDATWEPRQNLEHAVELVRRFDALKKTVKSEKEKNNEGEAKRARGRAPKSKT